MNIADRPPPYYAERQQSCQSVASTLAPPPYTIEPTNRLPSIPQNEICSTPTCNATPSQNTCHIQITTEHKLRRRSKRGKSALSGIAVFIVIIVFFIFWQATAHANDTSSSSSSYQSCQTCDDTIPDSIDDGVDNIQNLQSTTSFYA